MSVLTANSGNNRLRWWNRIIRIEQITDFSFTLHSVFAKSVMKVDLFMLAVCFLRPSKG